MAADGVGSPELSDRDSEFPGNGAQGVSAAHPVPAIGGAGLSIAVRRRPDGYRQLLTRQNAGPFQPVGPPNFAYFGT